MRACCFIGPEKMNAAAEEKIKNSLSMALQTVLAKGVCSFIYTGGAGFELAAAELLVGMKEEHPDISIVLSSPRAAWENRMYGEDRARAERIEGLADVRIDTVGNSGDLYARYIGAVRASECCIVKKTRGFLGTKLLVCAKECGKELLYAGTGKLRCHQER